MNGEDVNVTSVETVVTSNKTAQCQDSASASRTVNDDNRSNIYALTDTTVPFLDDRAPPPGSLFHADMLDKSTFPDNVQESHRHYEQEAVTLLANMLYSPTAMDSISHIHCHSRVLGLSSSHDEKAFATALYGEAAVYTTEWLQQNHPGLMDGGANIILTPHHLHLLIEVITLDRPVTIACATGDGSKPHIDDCCTKKKTRPKNITTCCHLNATTIVGSHY